MEFFESSDYSCEHYCPDLLHTAHKSSLLKAVLQQSFKANFCVLMLRPLAWMCQENDQQNSQTKTKDKWTLNFKHENSIR